MNSSSIVNVTEKENKNLELGEVEDNMLNKPYTLVENGEKEIFVSGTDYDYIIEKGDKCTVSVVGIVSAINDDGFVLETMNGENVSVQYEDICGVECEELYDEEFTETEEDERRDLMIRILKVMIIINVIIHLLFQY